MFSNVARHLQQKPHPRTGYCIDDVQAPVYLPTAVDLTPDVSNVDPHSLRVGGVSRTDQTVGRGLDAVVARFDPLVGLAAAVDCLQHDRVGRDQDGEAARPLAPPTRRARRRQTAASGQGLSAEP